MFSFAVLLSSWLLFRCAVAACTREHLQNHLDLFFVDAIIHDELPLAPDVKISSNGVMQSTLNTTAFANITWIETPEFKIQALDTAACQGARYTVTRQKSSDGKEAPALVSIRMALADNNGHITEIEITNVLKGEHILFYPDKFELRTPPLFNSSQAFPPGAPIATTKVLSRKEIITIADSYVNAVQKGDKAAVKAGTNCPRTANGQRIGDHCEEGDQGLAAFHWALDSKRWIADPDKGIAFGTYIVEGTLGVDENTWDLVNEFVAVKDGLIREVRVIMAHTPKGTKAVWPEDSTRSYSTL